MGEHWDVPFPALTAYSGWSSSNLTALLCPHSSEYQHSSSLLPTVLLLLPTHSCNPLPPPSLWWCIPTVLPELFHAANPFSWSKSSSMAQTSTLQPPGRGWVKQERNIPLHWSATAPWSHGSPAWPSTWGQQLTAVTWECGGWRGSPGPGECISPLTAVEMSF